MNRKAKTIFAIVFIMATLLGGFLLKNANNNKTTRGRQEEVQAIESTNKSQAKPEAQTTTENNSVKVEATQPEVESYNDSIAPTYENEGATEATTTTGSTNNKVVAEDNEAAIKAADEEIRQASENGAIIVEDQETGVTAVTETQPAAEEKGETQQRVDLDFSSAVDATNEK